MRLSSTFVGRKADSVLNLLMTSGKKQERRRNPNSKRAEKAEICVIDVIAQ